MHATLKFERKLSLLLLLLLLQCLPCWALVACFSSPGTVFFFAPGAGYMFPALATSCMFSCSSHRVHFPFIGTGCMFPAFDVGFLAFFTGCLALVHIFVLSSICFCCDSPDVVTHVLVLSTLCFPNK